MGEWMPIESCPRDGTPVLFLRDGEVGFGCAVDKVFDGIDLSSFNAAWGREGTISLPLNDPNWPTHWMPLPEPPAQRIEPNG